MSYTVGIMSQSGSYIQNKLYDYEGVFVFLYKINKNLHMMRFVFGIQWILNFNLTISIKVSFNFSMDL